MAPHPDTDLVQDQKNELIMEKRLRADKANIISMVVNRFYTWSKLKQFTISVYNEIILEQSYVILLYPIIYQFAISMLIFFQNRRYFSDSDSYATHPNNMCPESHAPSPSADKNAKNTNALRYWNQCMDKTTQRQNNEQRLHVESSNSSKKSHLSRKA